MSNNRPHIKNLKSNSLLDGEARKPESADLDYGEIAINYSTGKETIFIKNDTDEIVSFKSSEQTESEIEEIRQTISDDELVISSALNDLNDRIIDESEERSNADNEISQRLGNEITNRESADRILRSDVMSAINNLEAEIPSPDGTTITMDYEGKFKVNTHDGFLIDENGINVAVGSSLTTESGDIEVKPGDDTIIVDINGVSVNVNDEGGIGYDSNGLYVKTGDGLTVDTDTVKVNTPSNSGLTVDSNGVSVKATSGISVGSNGVSVNCDTAKALDFDSNGTLGVRISDGIEFKEYDNNKKGISVKPKTNGGISVDSNGVSINTGDGITVDNTTGKLKVITGNTIEISTGGSIAVKQGDGVYTGSDGLAVKAASNGGLTVDSNGVSVKQYNGIMVDSNGVGAKLKTNGGLSVNSDGLYLNSGFIGYDVIINFDITTFNASTGELSLPYGIANIVYNPNDYTVNTIIGSFINTHNIGVKCIVSFKSVGSNFHYTFPLVWEGNLICTQTGGSGSYAIYNPHFSLFTKDKPNLAFNLNSSVSTTELNISNIFIHDFNQWLSD